MLSDFHKFNNLNWLRKKSHRHGKTVFSHNGGTGGFHSFLAFVKDAGVLILSNVSGPVDELGVRAAADIAEMPVKPGSRSETQRQR